MRHVQHARLARRVAAVAAVLLAALTGVAGQASAEVATTPLVSDSFTGSSTAGGWYLPAGSNGTCLTAGSSTTQRPVPACSTTALDAVGSGTLRLTRNVGNAVGTMDNTMSLPGSRGLDITFNTYQWNGLTNPGADGISFILAATDPSNPAPPANPGPNGGSLGYSSTRSNSAPGVSYGYLGFGLDVYGNFEGQGFGGTDCGPSGRVEQSITVRGPGNDNLGYCKLASAAVAAPAHLDDRLATTRPAPVPVEIAINPGAATTTASGIAVAANSWVLQVTPLGAAAPMQLTGPLPTGARLAQLGFPTSYVDPATGLPYQLTFGWAASTGGNNEIHEINMLESATLNGKVPALALAVSDSQSGHLVAGNQSVVTVTPSLSATEGAEDQPLTVTTVFPPGLTPAPPTTSEYSCSVSGQLVSCVYTPSAPLLAGSSLPPLDIPIGVEPTASGNLTVTSKVSSNDALPTSASHQVDVTAFVAQANPGSVAYGSAVTLSTSGLPANATGTVSFSSGGQLLCTVTLPATSCSTAAGLDAQTYPVTAAYSGDAGYLPQSTTTSFTVVPAATSLTASVAAASVAYGIDDPLSAAGLPPGATGTITFTSGGQTLCTVAAPGGTCTPAGPLAVGSYPVTAAYGGDGDHAASSATVTFEVTKLVTSLVAAVADPSVEFGAGQTLSWTGLDPDATGTVTFSSGGTTLCVATLPATSCSPPPGLEVGAYPVTATYSGDTTHQGTTDGTQFEVTKAATDVVVQAAPTVPYGTAQTLSVSGLPADATGTVTLVSNGTPLCTVTLPATSCSAPAGLDVGSYPVTATYAGDDHYLGSSDSTSFVVDLLTSPTFAAQANPATTTYGDADTLSSNGLAAGATGSVVFTAGGQTLCEVALPATSCTAPADLAVGTYQVTATYPGDSQHAAVSATTSFEVTKAPIALVAGVVDPSLPFGTPQTLTVSGVPTGAQGTVTFTSGGVVLCTVTLPATTCAAPADVEVGQQPVQAVYSGDANHQGAQAGTGYSVVKLTSQVVAGVVSATTPYGVADTVLFTGLPADASGTVTFTANGQTLCVATLPAHSCTASANLEVGSYPVTATYSGDQHYTGSSDQTGYSVLRLGTSIAAVAAPAVAVEGTTVTLTAVGLPADATGTVRFTSKGRTLCVATLPATSCTSTTALTAGGHAVTAGYSGDAHHLPSSARTSYRRTSVTAVEQAATTRSGVTIGVPLPPGGGQVVVVSPPANGSVVVQQGQLVYTPTAGFTGTDVVTVQITDAHGNVRVVDVQLRVLADLPSSTTQLDRLPRTGGFAGGTLALAAGLLLVGAAASAAGRCRGRDLRPVRR